MLYPAELRAPRIIVSSLLMAVETEIKLRLPDDSASTFETLARLGYKSNARTLEVDQIYDRPDAELKLSRRLLRLRSRGERWTVTYKGPPSEGPHKSREEVEADVDDGVAFAHILSSLSLYIGCLALGSGLCPSQMRFRESRCRRNKLLVPLFTV